MVNYKYYIDYFFTPLYNVHNKIQGVILLNKIILFISIFLISFVTLSIISEIIIKKELIFRIKMWWTIRNFMKALSKMYYYICWNFDKLNNNSEEMTESEINDIKEKIRDSSSTLLEVIKQRTDKDNIAFEYLSSKNLDFLKKMSDDVKNILKIIN